MNTVFDSSAFAKRYIEEEGSQTVDEICQHSDSLGMCVISVPEVFSALNRRRREEVLSAADYELVKAEFSVDLRDITLLDLTPAVIVRSITLLETYSLRAMDALHIACALEWQTDLFVSSDHRQIAVALKTELQTKLV